MAEHREPYDLREYVRFWERVGVGFPRATRQVVISIAGEPYWLWRAVDQHGFILDVLVQRRRDSFAARRLMTKLLKAAVTPPRVMITDKLRSYGAALDKIGLRVDHRQHKGLNNRAENSHQPTRRRERIISASSQPGKRNGSCRFTIKSRTSYISLIQNLQRLQPAALRVTAALLSGARFPTQAPWPDAHLDQSSSPLGRSSLT